MAIIQVIPMQVEMKQLYGSVKQVAWAEEIRSTVINHVAKHGNERSIRRESFQSVLNILCAQISASWWINHRGSIVELIRSLSALPGDNCMNYVADEIQSTDRFRAQLRATRQADANHAANKRAYY